MASDQDVHQHEGISKTTTFSRKILNRTLLDLGKPLVSRAVVRLRGTDAEECTPCGIGIGNGAKPRDTDVFLLQGKACTCITFIHSNRCSRPCVRSRNRSGVPLRSQRVPPSTARAYPVSTLAGSTPQVKLDRRRCDRGWRGRRPLSRHRQQHLYALLPHIDPSSLERPFGRAKSAGCGAAASSRTAHARKTDRRTHIYLRLFCSPLLQYPEPAKFRDPRRIR
ncbi:hypothetical protein BKA93DRAFT_258537 [Sparassis latifolia]